MNKISPSKSREKKFIMAMMFPVLFFELFVHLTPMVIGFIVSIKAVNINTMADWLHAPTTWFNNYKEFLTPGTVMNNQFWSSSFVTLKYGIITKFFHFGLGLWGALLLNRKFKGRGFFRMLFMIPYAVPSFISAISWKFMFQKEWGLVNYLLVDKLHLLATKPFWLVGGNALYAVATAQIWRGWSFHFIMILAGLQTIPTELYDAVKIDGGNAWHSFRHVTLVGLMPVLTTLLVVNGMRIFNEFETTYVMLSERPPSSANVMAVNIYNQAFNNWNFGVASAFAILWVIIIFSVSLLLSKLLRREDE